MLTSEDVQKQLRDLAGAVRNLERALKQNEPSPLLLAEVAVGVMNVTAGLARVHSKLSPRRNGKPGGAGDEEDE